MWIKRYIEDIEDRIKYFESLKQREYIFYEKLGYELSYVFRYYFDFKNMDVKGSRILIANNNKESTTHYAECEGYILYDLSNVDYNNILYDMKEKVEVFKNIVKGI